MELWAIQNLTEISFTPCLFSYSLSPRVIAHSILYFGIRYEDRIGFQPTRNTIACLQFDHAQRDLNQQQIDLCYNCTVNLTGNTIK